MGPFGINARVDIAEEITVGLEADIESQGTQLETIDGQATDDGTKTLLTASANKVLLVKRVELAVDIDQENANGPFKFQVIDGADAAQVITKTWNPKTGATYGQNVSPDFVKSGTAKSVELVIPTGFTDKLDWIVHYQEVDA